jgi:6-pyruvoyltetrahydropterin/6-carboxytetrahydropterin synthase
MARAPGPAGAAGTPVVEVTRTFQFSAAHRMHNRRFTAAENRRLYGRCNNPEGHGHTYRLGVTLRGPISSDTGSMAGEPDLHGVVRDMVLGRFHQANLDELIGPGDGPTSTTEVLAGLLWRMLDAALPAGWLRRLRLEETPNNFFELECQRAVRPRGRTAERTPPTGVGKRAQDDRAVGP